MGLIWLSLNTNFTFPTALLSSCVALERFLNLSDSQFPHRQMGYHAACPLGPVRQIKCIRRVYPIEQCLGHSKWKWNWKSLSRVQLFATPWTILSMEFSRPEYWTGCLLPSPGDLPNPGIQLRSPTLQVDSLPSESQAKPKNTGVDSLSLLQWIFPTQESNHCLLHCRQILYQLNHKRST